MPSARSLACLLTVVAATTLLPPAAAAANGSQAPRRYVPLDVVLLTPVQIFPFQRKVVIGVNVNVLYSSSAAVYGLEVGGLVNREREGMGGIQIAGLGNSVKGRAVGLQVGGLWNSVRGPCGALQLSIGINHCDSGGALQVALVNRGGDGLEGLQIGGVLNTVTRSSFSVQLSFFYNNAIKDFAGLQVSLLNFDNQTLPLRVGTCGPDCEITQVTKYPDALTRGVVIGVGNLAQRMHGLQIGAFSATGELRGVQLGGVNVARDVHGLQLGVLNVARTLHGVQLGALNVAYRNALPVMVLVNAGF